MIFYVELNYFFVIERCVCGCSFQSSEEQANIYEVLVLVCTKLSNFL